MPLVNLTTNLKSLRYGKDRIGGGRSNQPYVTRSIPEDLSDVGRTGGPDFLLRGGTLLPRIAVNDVSRLTQMLVDFRSPNGPLFIAKQNVLSLTNVNSDAGYEVFTLAERDTSGNFFQRAGSAISTFVKNNLAANQGIYSPLGTIAQAGVNALGIHLNKQGLNPFTQTTVGSPTGNTPLGLPTYLNTIYTPGDIGPKSRLEPLLAKITKNTNGDNILYTYKGGPGATLGVGRTEIKMSADQRTGINNKNNVQLQFNNQFNNNLSLFSNTRGGNIEYKPSIYIPSQNKSKNLEDIQVSYGASTKYFSSLSSFAQGAIINTGLFFNESGVVAPLFPSVYESGTLLKTNLENVKSGINKRVPNQVFTQKQVETYTPTSKDAITSKPSFTSIIAPSGSDYISAPLDYTRKNIEQRVNLGDPGRRGNLTSYTIGKREFGSNTPNSVARNADYTHALDKINALPIYKSSEVTTNNIKNDLVKFRIGILDNENPSEKTYIHFRALINGLSDNYSAKWDEQKYMGRGENFYRYGGFDRKISLGWTVAAMSKQELIPMYQKLNYLASAITPDYSPAGYLRGNLISLTIGGWFQEQIGIMTGLNLEVPEDAPWEIAIPDGLGREVINPGTVGEIASDSSVKEMPKIINVSGFEFIPIHNFVPRVQQNKFRNGKKLPGGGTFIDSYGKEQYIQLAAFSGNNYDGQANNLTYIP